MIPTPPKDREDRALGGAPRDIRDDKDDGKEAPHIGPCVQRIIAARWHAIHQFRQRWATRRLLLAVISVALFGLLGAVGILVAHISKRHAPLSWPRRSRFVAALLASVVLLMVAPLAPSPPSSSLPSQKTVIQPGLETMAGLYNTLNDDAGSGPPIRIVSVGHHTDNTIVVMLRGQEKANQTFACIKSGIGMNGDPVAGMVRTSIEAYRRAHGLASGTSVILAGHSCGGIIAQEIANDPGDVDFTVAAVVTWGAPTISAHADGVTYQQYFSQYDFVPMLSSYYLGPLVAFLGSGGALGALAIMQLSPGLKAAFTGQTYVPDMDHYWNPIDWFHIRGTWNDAHDGYGRSHWLAQQTLTYMRDGKPVPLVFVT